MRRWDQMLLHYFSPFLNFFLFFIQFKRLLVVLHVLIKPVLSFFFLFDAIFMLRKVQILVY